MNFYVYSGLFRLVLDIVIYNVRVDFLSKSSIFLVF